MKFPDIRICKKGAIIIFSIDKSAFSFLCEKKFLFASYSESVYLRYYKGTRSLPGGIVSVLENN